MRRHLRLRGIGLLAASALVLAACGDDADTTTDTDALATDAAAVSSDPPSIEGNPDWAAAVDPVCADFKQATQAQVGPIFASSGPEGPDGEAVRQLFVDQLPRLEAVIAEVEAAAPPEEQAEAHAAFLEALQEQLAQWQVAVESPEAAVGQLQEQRGAFVDDAGLAGDAAGAHACGTGTTFAQAELTDAEKAAAPVVAVDAVDYGFEVDGDFVVGHNVIAFANAGGEPHEVLLFELTGGTSAEDAIAWFEENHESDEEPPFLGAMVGGFGAPNGRTEIAADLVAGEYLMICFIPTEADGTPHFLKGMHRAVTIA